MGCPEIRLDAPGTAPGTEPPSIRGLSGPTHSPTPLAPALTQSFREGIWDCGWPGSLHPLGATARGGGLRAEIAPLPQTSAGRSPHCSEAPGQEERKELRSNARAPPRWGPGGREREGEGACQPSPSPQTERRPQAPAVWTGGRHRLGMGWGWGWGVSECGTFPYNLLSECGTSLPQPPAPEAGPTCPPAHHCTPTGPGHGSDATVSGVSALLVLPSPSSPLPMSPVGGLPRHQCSQTCLF